MQYTAKLNENTIKEQAYKILKEKAAIEAANNPVEVNPVYHLIELKRTFQ